MKKLLRNKKNKNSRVAMFSAKGSFFIILIALCTLCSNYVAYSQLEFNEGWALVKKYEYYGHYGQYALLSIMTLNQFGKHIFLTNGDDGHIVLFDFDGNEVTRIGGKAYSDLETTPIIIPNPNNPSSDLICYVSYYGLDSCFTQLDTNYPDLNPKTIRLSELFGIIPKTIGSGSNLELNICLFQYFRKPSDEHIWCYVTMRNYIDDGTAIPSLYFANYNKPDSAIVRYVFPRYDSKYWPYPDDKGGFEILPNVFSTEICFNALGNDYFFKASWPQYTIVRFNSDEEKFTLYSPQDWDFVDKDWKLKEDFTVYDEETGISYTDYAFNCKRLLYCGSTATHNYWMISIQDNRENRITKNILLSYSPLDDGFKSMQINPEYYPEGSSIRRCGMLNCSTIYFVPHYLHRGTDYIPPFGMGYRYEVTTYNLETGEYGSIRIPKNLINLNQAPNYGIEDVKELMSSEGKKYIGVTTDPEHFLLYDPSYIGIKDTDDGIFQEIGFRNVYPNPTAYRTTTAEIMCYVRDFSKLDIGLYNTMGEKILDLNSDYEYNDATKTIYTTIKLPSNYPDGIYYLNIRDGSERRTQGVIFGNISK